MNGCMKKLLTRYSKTEIEDAEIFLHEIKKKEEDWQLTQKSKLTVRDDKTASILIEMTRLQEELANGSAPVALRRVLCDHNLQIDPVYDVNINECLVKNKGENKEKKELQRNAASNTPHLTKERFRFIIFALLKRPKFSNIISWMQDGRSWKIHATEVFERLIIPVFFPKVTTYNSFALLTKIFGFKSFPSNPNGWFYSEDFLREEVSHHMNNCNVHAPEAFLVENSLKKHQPSQRPKLKKDIESFYEKCNKTFNAPNKFFLFNLQQSKQLSHTSKQNSFLEESRNHHVPKKVKISCPRSNEQHKCSTNFQETSQSTKRKRLNSKISEYMSDTFSQMLSEEINETKKKTQMDFF